MRDGVRHIGGDERGRHGGCETDVLEGVALLKFGAGRHGCFEARAEFAVRGPITLEARSRPAATAPRGLAVAAASAMPSARSLLRASWPATISSRLSEKWRKKVLFVTPARPALCATVVASYPRSANRS
jgi:hypothetical protein